MGLVRMGIEMNEKREEEDEGLGSAGKRMRSGGSGWRFGF